MDQKDKVNELYDIYKEDKYMVNKYLKAGIYCIKIEDKIVYVGKSRDMLMRLCQHIINIETSKINKYKVLREAKEKNHTIEFAVLYTSSAETQEGRDIDIGYQEAVWINELYPPLNYQIPKLHNYKSYTIQHSANTIRLEDILDD